MTIISELGKNRFDMAGSFRVVHKQAPTKEELNKMRPYYQETYLGKFNHNNYTADMSNFTHSCVAVFASLPANKGLFTLELRWLVMVKAKSLVVLARPSVILTDKGVSQFGQNMERGPDLRQYITKKLLPAPTNKNKKSSNGEPKQDDRQNIGTATAKPKPTKRRKRKIAVSSEDENDEADATSPVQKSRNRSSAPQNKKTSPLERSRSAIESNDNGIVIANPKKRCKFRESGAEAEAEAEAEGEGEGEVESEGETEGAKGEAEGEAEDEAEGEAEGEAEAKGEAEGEAEDEDENEPEAEAEAEGEDEGGY